MAPKAAYARPDLQPAFLTASRLRHPNGFRPGFRPFTQPLLLGVGEMRTSEVLRKLQRLGAMRPRELAHRSRAKLYSQLERIGAGYLVQRSGWGPLDSHLVFDCGGLGMLTGAHAHADALSLTLFNRGRELLVDPGTFVYNCAPECPGWGRRFRLPTIRGRGTRWVSADATWSDPSPPPSVCPSGIVDRGGRFPQSPLNL
jgi:hypothetical protein